MAYENLKAAIKQAIKQNGNQEITGNLLQSTLLNIVNTLGAEYKFLGFANSSTVPPTSEEGRLLYFTTGHGDSYINFPTSASSTYITLGYGVYALTREANSKYWRSDVVVPIAQESGTAIDKIMSQGAVKTELDKKIDKASIAQESGTAIDKIMSQGAVKTELDKKIDKASIAQESGTSIDKIMSQGAVKTELDKKIDKASIAQESGTSKDKVMSQKAIINYSKFANTTQAYARINKSTKNFIGLSVINTSSVLMTSLFIIPNFNIDIYGLINSEDYNNFYEIIPAIIFLDRGFKYLGYIATDNSSFTDLNLKKYNFKYSLAPSNAFYVVFFLDKNYNSGIDDNKRYRYDTGINLVDVYERITQVEGDSDILPMSQKAVKDIAKNATKVSNDYTVNFVQNLFQSKEIKLESTGDKSTTNASGDFAAYNTCIFMAGTIVKSIKLKVSSLYVNGSSYYCKLAVVNKSNNNYFTIDQESEKFKIDNSKEGIITIQTNFEFKTEGLIGIGFSPGFSPLYSGTPSGYNGFFYNTRGYNPDIDNSIIYLPQLINRSYGVSIYMQAKYIPSNFITRPELEEAVKNIKSFTNYLDGKKILAVGDSMVAGHSIPDSSGNTWLAKIATRNNMTRYNKGTNGAKMAKIAYGGTTDNSVYSKICENGTSMYINDEIMNSVDYILIYAGTNDIAANVTIGELSSSNPQEFCGALNLICQNLQTRAPQSHIGFITPQLRAGIEQKCWDYINAIENICKKYSIPVYNQGLNSGICWTNTAIKNTLTLNDTYHLNVKGMEFISYKYEGFLREI